MQLARERGQRFAGFEQSRYASGRTSTNICRRSGSRKPNGCARCSPAPASLPDRESWRQLRDDVMRYGIYNRYLQAVPPTGSISYINHATSSIHPIVSKIEIRKEGNRASVLPRAIYE